MTRIVRISQAAFPHRTVRSKIDQRPQSEPAATQIQIIDPDYRATTRRHMSGRQGPSATFLAQYVDQHWPWPRDPQARVRARTVAAAAYGAMDETPLDDTRGRHLSRRI